MKATIRDKEALGAVSLLDLLSYLRANGWSEGQPFERFHQWLHPSGNESSAEIILPRDPEAGDLIPRVSDALATLEQVEQRSQLAILHDLVHASADVIRIRRAVNDGRDGSIPIEDGVLLFENARDLLSSAASAAVSPRRVFPSRRPAQAVDYMNSMRLGQTERGSYVVTIISPVTPLLTPGQPGLLELMGEPFPRKVTRVLSGALEATLHASEEAAASGSLQAFNNGVASGISANLCDAIVGLAGAESERREVSVSTFWAASRPYEANPRPQVRFSPGVIPYIEEAARMFRGMEPMEGVTIVGPVVTLHRDPDSPIGTATVSCVLEGKSRHLRAYLGDRDYQEAIQAHRDHRALAFEADVVRDGRALRAENVRDLRTLTEE